MIHKHVVLGGTFDRLHKGHVSFIKAAFENGERVTIGLTTDKLHEDKELSQTIQTYDIRKKELIITILANWPKALVEVIPIEDIYGSSVTDSTIDAIVVTDLTLENGKQVNELRIKKGLGEVKIILVPLVQSDDSKILSSSRIRRGEIDRYGKVYNQQLIGTLKLPESLRAELRKPLGTVVEGNEDAKDEVADEVKKLVEKEKYTVSIAVGDVVSSALEKAGFLPDIKIIDFKTQRKFLPSYSAEHNFDTENTAGTVSSASSRFLQKEIEKIMKNKARKTITIDGEEDLLVLPVILLAPLESIVFYGQRESGMVVVKVTEEMKKRVSELISRFV